MKVSIVIRTYGMELIVDILEAIDNQHVYEISIMEIVIVNGDTKSQLDKHGLVSRYDLVFVDNCLTPYRPGRALNIGIEKTTGDFVAFLSGHSIPADNNWLVALVDKFSQGKVACVCGAQICRAESNQIEKLYRCSWYRCKLIAHTFRHFNMANSALKKEYWNHLRFDEDLEGCEDRLWSQLVSLRYGVAIRFASEAKVIHSHVCSIADTSKYFIWLGKTSLAAKCKYISAVISQMSKW